MREVEVARDICREISLERPTFAELNAKKYLDEINVRSVRTAVPLKKPEPEPVYCPWRRFFARTFDLQIYSALWWAFLVLVLPLRVNLMDRGWLGTWMDSFAATVMMLFLEPVWLCLWGTTPGKALLGLSLKTYNGGRLIYSYGLERTWVLICSGLGWNIPVYSLVCLRRCDKRNSARKTQPWEDFTYHILKEPRGHRTAAYIGASTAILFICLTMMLSQQLPPNRGDLTKAQFAENYNYYAEYYGVELNSQYLNEDGIWVGREGDPLNYSIYSSDRKPAYAFKTEDGYVTGVSFSGEIYNGYRWVEQHVRLAALALAGAQREVGLFSGVPRRLIREIGFFDSEFEAAGIKFSCDASGNSYSEIVDGGPETRPHLSFSAQKLAGS